jgi:HlyD family secretion protein
MVLTIGDEGETRVIDVFTVFAPITGRLRRLEAEPGDAVIANETIIAEIEPTASDLLDPRSEAEAKAQLHAAISAESLARAELDKAEAELQFARSELERARGLLQKGTISARDLEAAERAFKTSRAATSVAQATMQVRKYELERARAQLMSPIEMQARQEVCECVSIMSPVDGRVLRILRESAGYVPAGEGLIEIGDPERLEIVVDLLSIDAVKVRPGQRAIIENWGGDGQLNARVRLIEPFGFTKISALGIEEQRVNVVLDIVSPRDRWSSLGHGYQVDVRIVLWENPNVLQVPLTALFRVGEDWALFVREEGKAVRRIVEVGNRTARGAQVLSGLASGEQVVVYPGEGIDDGVRIKGR